MIEDISEQTGVSRTQTLAVVEAFCREIHKTAYEYNGGNGDFVCEELLWQIGDRAWIHLYQFLLMYSLKYPADTHPEDQIGMHFEVLKYMGEREEWNDALRECRKWQMAEHYGLKSVY